MMIPPKLVSAVRSENTAKPVLELASGERWYCVHTKPHRETGAEAQLTAQGFRTFLPRHRKTVRHARKHRTVVAAFFPRYLFVVLDLKRDRWRSVNGTFGVSRMVMGEDDLPMPVPAGVVENFIAVTDPNDGVLQFGASLELGQSVCVLEGPFAPLIGEIARFDGRDRVRVLLRMLGGTVPVQVERGVLVPAA